jgi:glutamine amidotransferase PdxT
VFTNSALQGAFLEHEIPLKNVSVQGEIEVIFVRTAPDLALCDALIIPGGGTPLKFPNWTAMAIIVGRVYVDRFARSTF